MAGLNAEPSANDSGLPPDDKDVEDILVDGGAEPEAKSAPKADQLANMLRDQLRTVIEPLDRRMQQFEAKFGAIDQKTQAVLDRSLGAEQRGFARAREEIKAEMRRAVAEADTGKHDALSEQLDQLEKLRPSAPATARAEPAAQPTVQSQQYIPPEVNSWVAENPWFTRDPQLNEFAVKYEKFLTDMNPGMSNAEKLKLVTEETKSKYPNKFDNPRRSQPAAVAAQATGANPRGAASARKKERSFSDIPEGERDHAKAAFDRLKRIAGMKEADYLKSYFKENE